MVYKYPRNIYIGFNEAEVYRVLREGRVRGDKEDHHTTSLEHNPESTSSRYRYSAENKQIGYGAAGMCDTESIGDLWMLGGSGCVKVFQ